MTPLRPILLVEDNPMDVELTLRAFAKKRVPNPVEVVRDGEEALQRIDDWLKGEPLPLLILLDLKLPKVDGLEVLKRIKEQPGLRSIPVVVLTSSEEERDVRTAYSVGANSYIVKPVDFDRFMDIAAQIESYWCLLNKLPGNP